MHTSASITIELNILIREISSRPAIPIHSFSGDRAPFDPVNLSAIENKPKGLRYPIIPDPNTP